MQRSVRDYTAPIASALGLDLGLEEARRCLQESGRAALPVLEAGHLVGIVTKDELDLAAAGRDGLLRDLLRLRVVYCFADSDVDEAEATMQAASVSHLAVLGEDVGLLGLVARSDLPHGDGKARRQSLATRQGTSPPGRRYPGS